MPIPVAVNHKPSIDGRNINGKTTSLDMFSNNDYICLACRGRYKKRRNLVKHVKTYHYEQEKELMVSRCDPCRLNFHLGHQYQRHYIAVHDRRPDAEVAAEYAASPKSEMRTPTPRTSPTPYVVICQHCSKDCKTGYNLRIHMRSHTVDIHACKICQQVLKNIPSTEGHIKRQHRA